MESLWDTSVKKYTAVKERLLNTFNKLNKGVQRLLTGINLGDIKPSHILQILKALTADGVLDNITKSLFLQKMLVFVRHNLMVSDEDIEKLALMANRVIEM